MKIIKKLSLACFAGTLSLVASGCDLDIAIGIDIGEDIWERMCGGHGIIMGGECHCDPGFAQDPQNSLNCVQPDQPEPECSGHGHLHGDRCHCDPGFVLDSEDPTKCVEPEPEPEPECSGHGHLHGERCHCDPGFVLDSEDPTKCVEPDPEPEPEPEPECSGHGHLHGNDCHCDPGFVMDPEDSSKCIAENNDPDAAPKRLAVADTKSGKITFLNLKDGSTAAEVELSGPARIYSTESGRFAAAVQYKDNRVDFIDSGLTTGGGKVQAPRKLDFALDGKTLGSQNPVHFVSHSGYITVNFDGKWDAEGGAHVPAKSVVIAEERLSQASPTPNLVVETDPQHGVSMVSASGHLIMTEPSLDREKSSLPSGVSVRALQSGAVLQSFNDGGDFQASCWGLHGEAQAGSSTIFGCHQELDGGALLLRWDAEAMEFETKKLAYPGYPKATKRTSILKSHPKNGYFVGQWGSYSNGQNFYRGLVRISENNDVIREEETLDLGAVYCSFDFERAEGQLVAALTRKGDLHVVDVNNWKKLGVVKVLPDSSADESCSGGLTMGEGVAYVSDTKSGRILEVDLDSLRMKRNFSVGGAPYGMALLGSSK